MSENNLRRAVFLAISAHRQQYIKDPGEWFFALETLEMKGPVFSGRFNQFTTNSQVKKNKPLSSKTLTVIFKDESHEVKSITLDVCGIHEKRRKVCRQSFQGLQSSRYQK